MPICSGAPDSSLGATIGLNPQLDCARASLAARQQPQLDPGMRPPMKQMRLSLQTAGGPERRGLERAPRVYGERGGQPRVGGLSSSRPGSSVCPARRRRHRTKPSPSPPRVGPSPRRPSCRRTFVALEKDFKRSPESSMWARQPSCTQDPSPSRGATESDLVGGRKRHSRGAQAVARKCVAEESARLGPECDGQPVFEPLLLTRRKRILAPEAMPEFRQEKERWAVACMMKAEESPCAR